MRPSPFPVHLKVGYRALRLQAQILEYCKTALAQDQRSVIGYEDL